MAARFSRVGITPILSALLIVASGAACSASDGDQGGEDDENATGGVVLGTGNTVGDGDGDGDATSSGGTGGAAGDGDGDGDLPTTGGAVGDGDGDGDLPATGGATGDGDGDIAPTPMFMLSESNGLFIYTLGDSSMTIDPSDGGRVVSYVVEGHETLVQAGGAASQYGSVFWPSPQSDWNWPPPAEIDSGAYAPSVSGDTLTLSSATNGALGLSVTSEFSPTTTTGGTPALSITYTIHNHGSSPRTVAGWEVSRVASGISFYPTGPGGLLGKSDLPSSESGGYTWYSYPGSSGKDFGDGSDGWLAWSTGDAVVIKSFVDISSAQFASGEAEIEIYADPSGNYFEVEQQGPATAIAAGGTSTWTVVWAGAEIPDGSDTSMGSTDLTTLVLNTL